ncbi:hypothetical protein H6F44_12665 [Pseudanabaena sp. FACHB-1277]|uniref:Uncharacterized protein n=1 Tax=Pseudanabaena cinerea FACHB-1277 TaxID=2949581 RepID=A0A926Z8D9_9CYAN|nr:hypothetical protein [Pseudanabaena cinerea]MBD2150964.1 hypothetical protein [Pseudanabaena cinerea FACHB-1277]
MIDWKPENTIEVEDSFDDLLLARGRDRLEMYCQLQIVESILVLSLLARGCDQLETPHQSVPILS